MASTTAKKSKAAPGAPVSSAAKTGPGGRPRKFKEPSQAITITLPRRTLEALATISEDRAKAMVIAVDALRPPDRRPGNNLVQIVNVADNEGLILVGANRLLSAIPFLSLAEVSPGRYILHLTPGTSSSDLEVALDDILENQSSGTAMDRLMIEQLRACLKKGRRNKSIYKGEMLIVRTD